MKQQKLQISSFLLAALVAASCSNEDAPYNPNDDPNAVELGVTAGVTLTKSAINGNDETAFDKIAVFASGNDYEDGNNYAIYTKNGSSWKNDATTPKIYLTHETATIYAVYPAYDINQSASTKWTVTNLSSNPTVPISVFAGNGSADANNKYPTDINNADKIFSGENWNTDNTDKDKIISALGEIDFMWAEDNDNKTHVATASNGKKSGSTSPDASVSLNMRHGLAMVSFRIYNDGNYHGAGSLTGIKLSNVLSSDVALSKGTNPTMSLKDGTITPNTPVDVTYYRFIEGGSPLIKVGTPASATVATTEADAKNASKKFSFLVLPDPAAADGVDKHKIQVTFTIDNTDYTVPLAGTTDTSTKWLAGTNNLYSVKLSGQELTISSVTVQAWSSGNDTSLDVK